MFRPAARFLIAPRPPDLLAARFLAAVILPPLLFFAILKSPPLISFLPSAHYEARRWQRQAEIPDFNFIFARGQMLTTLWCQARISVATVRWQQRLASLHITSRHLNQQPICHAQ
jgi:hypothetical protein